MIEIISSILDAEKKADDIIKNSTEKSIKIKTDSENECEKIKNDAITFSKIHRKTIISNAIKKAEEEYDKIIIDGKTKIQEEMNNSIKKIEEIANEIFLDLIK